MTEWKRVRYLCDSDAGPVSEHVWRYELTLPTPRADWDVYAYWEATRTRHMAATLQPGDCLYDVGAEDGWLSTVYAQMVGPENMVLIEPSGPMWPNIRQTWLRNYDRPPLAVAQCLVGSAGDPDLRPAHFATNGEGGWPDASNGPLTDRVSYAYLHEHAHQVPTVTLDRLVTLVGRPPAAVTVDVEGAELLVLQGAERTLRDHAPHLWVSVHPELTRRHHGYDADGVHAFLTGLGYVGEHLGTDHEQHWHYAKGGA